jgi:hypothetical protein
MFLDPNTTLLKKSFSSYSQDCKLLSQDSKLRRRRTRESYGLSNARGSCASFSIAVTIILTLEKEYCGFDDFRVRIWQSTTPLREQSKQEAQHLFHERSATRMEKVTIEMVRDLWNGR